MHAPCQSCERPVILALLPVPFAPSSTIETEASPRFSIGSVPSSSIVAFTRTAGVGSGVVSPAGASVGAAVGFNPGPFTSAILFASVISSKYTDTDFVPFVGSLDSCGAIDEFAGVMFVPPGVVFVCGTVDTCGITDVCVVTVVWLFFFTRTFTTPIFRFLPFFDTSLTVIFAVPAVTAFTFPFLVTVATFFLLEEKV